MSRQWVLRRKSYPLDAVEGHRQREFRSSGLHPATALEPSGDGACRVRVDSTDSFHKVSEALYCLHHHEPVCVMSVSARTIRVLQGLYRFKSGEL